MLEDTNWSDYWSKEGESGEVFVDQNGHKNLPLSVFWKTHLSKIEQGSRIIDLACGAGSIYVDNVEKPLQLCAVDASQEALDKLNHRISGVKTIQSSISSIPLPDASFDLVVSQFGVEYAGINAFIEAARLMAKKSSLIMLCHYRNGYIDARNKIDLGGAQLVVDSHFIEQAIAITKATFAKNTEEYQRQLITFTQSEPEVAAYVNAHPFGFHTHCYAGFKKMYMKRSVYQLDDFIDWLNGMKKEAARSIIRLKEMRKAALSKKRMEDIEAILLKNGVTNITFKAFTIEGHQLPIAWLLQGNKN